MPIQEKFLRHWIDNFYGYGSWKAKIWFVGYEEGGGDLPEEVAEKLQYFNKAHAEKTPALCDIRMLYKQVAFRNEGSRSFTNLYEYRFGENAGLHGVWKNIIAFAHGFNNKKLPNVLKYQRSSFATTSEALIQLYPLPSPHNHAWYYSWLDLPGLSFIKHRNTYEDHVYNNRIACILENIRKYKPEVIVMYGMNNINTLKKSVQSFFPSAKFKMVKATFRQIPQYHCAHLDDTIMVITTQVPNLRHNRIETGFDWEKFGKTVAKK